jgi:thiol-disulfide isomerase/thioredoxin
MINSLFNELIKSFNNIVEDTYINIRLILSDKSLLVLSFILLILFICLGYFVYTNYITNIINTKHVLNRELVNNNSNDLHDNNIKIVFFKTEWCPYCKQSMIEWQLFEDYVNKINNTNSKQIKLLIIDCDEKPHIADKYEIEAYPTIKMFYDGEIYEYDAKPTKVNLIEFVESFVELN